MDYLSLLPVEIWRDIFSQVREHFWDSDKGLCDNSITVPRHGGIEEKRAKIVQRSLANLSETCKSLRPFVEEQLYSSVFLYTNRALRTFTTMASVPKCGSGGSRGELTRHLYLSLDDDDAYSISIDSVTRVCPNLTSFSISCIRDIHWNSWKDFVGHWPTTLRHFYWDSPFMPYNLLLFSSSHFTGLVSLHLSSLIVDNLENELVFPNVTHLCTVCLFIRVCNDPPLILPSLKRLSVEIVEVFNCDDIAEIIRFAQRHRQSLTEMQITERYDTVPADLALLMASGLCLETFILPINVMALGSFRIDAPRDIQIRLLVINVSCDDGGLLEDFHNRADSLLPLKLEQLILVVVPEHEQLTRDLISTIRSSQVLPRVCIEYRIASKMSPRIM